MLELMMFKNAFIWAIGGLLTRLIDVVKWRKISMIQAMTKVMSGSFISHFMTPYLSDRIGIPDQWFVSAVLWILWYKIIEYITSENFFEDIKLYLIKILKK